MFKSNRLLICNILAPGSRRGDPTPLSGSGWLFLHHWPGREARNKKRIYIYIYTHIYIYREREIHVCVYIYIERER